MVSHGKNVFFIAMVLVCACTSTAWSQDYSIGIGDILKVTVHYHEELGTTSRVNEDGMITLPLVGQVNVDGLTAEQASEEIARALADGYLINPQVSVFVQEQKKIKGVVIGAVGHPGLYELDKGTELFELISKAGGLTQDAGDKAIIRRKGRSEADPERTITVDLKALIEHGDLSQNVILEDGDNIYISEAGMFYVIGEVKRPDAYKFTKGTTVIKAITVAGGFTDRANPEKVRLIRKKDGTEHTVENVPMDEAVQPDDLIVVPESLF